MWGGSRQREVKGEGGREGGSVREGQRGNTMLTVHQK